MALLFAVLLVVIFLAWVNTIGVPDFVKRRMITELHQRGLDVQFSRMRWRFERGLVADNVTIGSTKQETNSNSPQFSMRQLAIGINHRDLMHARVKVDSVEVSKGRLFWPLGETNGAPLWLTVTNIQTQVRFFANDEWALESFSADFAGAYLQLSGTVSNATALRDLKILHGKAKQPGRLQERLRQLTRVVNEIKFEQTPLLTVNVNGDARNPRGFSGEMTLEAEGAETPWGTLKKEMLHLRVIPPANPESLPKLKGFLKAEDVHFDLHPNRARRIAGDTHNLHLDLFAEGDPVSTNDIRATMDLSASRFTTPWAQAADAHFNARWTHSLTNPIPNVGTGELRLLNAKTRWGTSSLVHLTAKVRPLLNSQLHADASWAWWARIEPYELDWDCKVEKLHAGDFVSSEAVVAGNWRAPVLTVTNIHTEMYDGRFDGTAGLNVVTRQAQFTCASDFDVLKIVPLMPQGARNWFAKQNLAWQKPPVVHGGGSVILPAWTNAHPNWRAEVYPTLYLGGDFQVGEALFRGMPVTGASSHIYLSNEVFQLPDLVAYRPEGKLEMAHISDERTQDYYFRFLSTIDAKIATRMAPTNAQRVINELTYEHPPKIDCEIWGRWHEHDSVGVKGQVILTNFVFRDLSATYLHTFFHYTNGVVKLTDSRLERTNEYISVSSVRIDFPEKRAYVTNGFCTMETMPILRAIGPHVARDMEPYKFLKTPTIQINGVIPISSDTEVADVHFRVDGGPFEWMMFHLPHVAGNVDWVGDIVTISQIQSTFYEGKLTGSAGFDFLRHQKGTELHFDMIATGVNLHSLMNDLIKGTNRLEGTLDAHLNITSANTEYPKSWFGKGSFDLREGFISDIPVFSILTPVLDSIYPGLGKTRATDAKGTFTINNSVIRSTDLVIYSSLLRLFYNGTVDFNRKVDAVVTAEVGRDTPIFGRLFGTISAPFGKLFETRITGNLENPKHEAVVPLFRWLSPFHWLHILRDVVPGAQSGENNPSPPRNK